MRILIAEDDPVSRKLLQATMSKWGYETVVCTNGLQALNGLEAQNAPELAILDWMMPEMDGAEVCRRIRSKQTAHPCYIILLTARATHDDVIGGLQAGADDYITKPFEPRELHARINAGGRIIRLQKQLSEKVAALESAMVRLGQVQQNNKLEAIGRLSAGIAHEINTPMQYIGDNVRFLQQTWTTIAAATTLLLELPEMIRSNNDKESLAKHVEGVMESVDLNYALGEVSAAVAQSLEGINRITGIVHAMRDFAHPSSVEMSVMDLNRAIEATITVARNEWKYVADLETALDAGLPPVPCHAAEIQQVILNLLINASHAIADAVRGTGKRGKITISTAVRDSNVEIRISDTGCGIPPEIRDQIFDPFFTTKDAGKGTGQGLTLARSIVVQRHKGKILFETEVGQGTTFLIQLPLKGASAHATVRTEALDPESAVERQVGRALGE